MIGLPQASSVSGSIDLLFNAMLALSAVVTLGVFAAIVWFGVKYRHGSGAVRSGEAHRHLGIELTWVLIPLVLFSGIFVWSLNLWATLNTVPVNATPINIIAKQWMWTVQHPGGQREINALHVPIGTPVRLVMTSEDVIHSFYVPAFRVKQDVLPGRYTELWFTATQEGTFELFCAEFCGTAHSQMGGSVVVMPPSQYASWLASNAGTGLSDQGAALFRQFGCSGCHSQQSGVHAPDLTGMYGRMAPLADGSVVQIDDRYLHDSIMLPKKQVAAGYEPVMPSYQGQIGEEQVLAIVAYLKTLGLQQGSANERP